MGEDRAGLLHELLGHLGRLRRRRIGRLRVERGHAHGLWVGVGHAAVEPLRPEHDHEAVLLDRLHERLHAGDLHGLEFFHDREALLRGDPAGAAIGDLAGGVEGAEVAAGGDVVGPEFEADAGGLEGAAADLELEGVVAEQAEVPGAGAGRDARQHRHARAARAPGGEPVEVGGGGRFELGLAPRIQRQAAEAVGHEHHDLGGVLLGEFADQFVLFHGGVPDTEVAGAGKGRWNARGG